MKNENEPLNPWETNSNPQSNQPEDTASSQVFSPSNPSFAPNQINQDTATPQTNTNLSQTPDYSANQDNNTTNTTDNVSSAQNQPSNTWQPAAMPINSYSNNSLNPTKKSRKKVYILGSGLVVLIGVLIATYVFFIFLPNKPENAWKTGFIRSGKALEVVSDKSTNEKSLQDYKKSEITGQLSITTAEGTSSGSLNAKYDQNKLIGNLSYSNGNQGDSEIKISADVLAEVANNEIIPDVFIKASGIKALLGEGYSDNLELSKYENKWILFDKQTISESIKSFTDEEPKKEDTITSKDVSDFSKEMVRVANQYVFTNDPNKAVIEQKSFVGMETIDGKKTYHYKAKVNEAHAKEYCKALIDSAAKTKLAKSYIKNQEDIDNAKKSCDDDQQISEEEKKVSGEFDMWIDARYKLIHKIRVYDGEDKKVYTDFGQNYSGGDDIEFFINYIDTTENQGEFKLTFKFNFKNATTKIEGTGFNGKDASKISGKINIDFKPYKSDIKIDRPKDFINAKDSILKGIQASSEDSERESDLHAVQSQLEAYYAQNDFYPSASEINNTAWVTSNLKGLDIESLKDPKGTSPTFSNAPTPNQYSYAPLKCQPNKTKCKDFVLIATLSNGEKFELRSLYAN